MTILMRLEFNTSFIEYQEGKPSIYTKIQEVPILNFSQRSDLLHIVIVFICPSKWMLE